MNQLTYKIGDTEIKEFTIEEIFVKNSLAPFLMIAQSGSGKTVLSIDVFNKCLHSGLFSDLHYVTTSYFSKDNSYLRDNVIPQVVIENGIIKKLNNILLHCSKSVREDHVLLQVGQKYDKNTGYNKSIETAILNNFKKTFQSSVLQKIVNTNTGIRIIEQAYSFQEIPKVIEYIQGSFDQLQKELGDYGLDEIDILQGEKTTTETKQGYLQKWKNSLEQMNKEYTNKKLQRYENFLIQHLQQYIKQDQALQIQFKDYIILGKKPQNEIIAEIAPAINPTARLCLIVDDISHILGTLSKTEKIPIIKEGSEVMMKEYEAGKFVLNQLFNKGRHLGTMLISVHKETDMDSDIYGTVKNVILSDSSQLFNGKKLFILEGQTKQEIIQIKKFLSNYNQTNNTKYLFVAYNDVTQSPDGKSKYAFFQANYKTTLNKFQIQNYKNQGYYNLLAQNYITKNNIQINENENENENSENGNGNGNGNFNNKQSSVFGNNILQQPSGQNQNQNSKYKFDSTSSSEESSRSQSQTKNNDEYSF